MSVLHNLLQSCHPDICCNNHAPQQLYKHPCNWHSRKIRITYDTAAATTDTKPSLKITIPVSAPIRITDQEATHFLQTKSLYNQSEPFKGLSMALIQEVKVPMRRSA